MLYSFDVKENDMQTFTGNISKKKFHISEKVPGKTVINGIMKKHPGFNEDRNLSVAGLNPCFQFYAGCSK